MTASYEVPAAWIPCDGCGDVYCRIHDQHAASCACPALDAWADLDPYSCTLEQARAFLARRSGQ